MTPGDAAVGEVVRELASALAPDLLQEVIKESREKAAAILRASLTSALVEEVERQLAGAVSRDADQLPPHEDPASQQSPADIEPGLYVYGITWSSTALTRTSGVAGGPVEKVVVGDLAAVVTGMTPSAPWGLDGDGELDLAALAPRVQEHSEVLEDVMEHGTVLPLRFGVMYEGADAVEGALRQQYETLRATLRRLENQGQWDLVLEWRGAPVSAHPSAASQPAGGRPGVTARGYLSHRASEQTTTQQTAHRARGAAMSVHEELSAIATEAIVQPVSRSRRADKRQLMKASYLVPSERADAFRDAADAALLRADVDLGIEGDLTGPWPPYNFSELPEERLV